MPYSLDDDLYYVLSEEVFGTISTDVREDVLDELEFAIDEGMRRVWKVREEVHAANWIDPNHPGLDKFLGECGK